MPWNPYRPGRFASGEPRAERRTKPITAIRQHAAEAHTGRDDTIDLCQSQLRLRPRRSIFGWNTGSLQPSLIARPTLGKKQSQPQHDRYFAARKRQRYQGLAIGGLAQRRSILRSNAHRMSAFLGYRSVVNHQHGIVAADEPICLDKLSFPKIPSGLGVASLG